MKKLRVTVDCVEGECSLAVGALFVEEEAGALSVEDIEGALFVRLREAVIALFSKEEASESESMEDKWGEEEEEEEEEEESVTEMKLSILHSSKFDLEITARFRSPSVSTKSLGECFSSDFCERWGSSSCRRKGP